MEDGEGNNGDLENYINSVRLKFSHQFWSILSYIILFGILLAVFWFFNCSLYNEGLDPDNVRYILSALIQSQAAIVTLTVSISLIAAQFMSSSYSIRIIEIFRDIRKNPDLWIILGIYLAVIIFDIYVLVFFNFTPEYVLIDDNLLFGFSSAECVGLSIFFGVFAIISLIPYIFNTLSILRLNTIIKILGEDIKSLELNRHKNQSLQIFHDLLISGISKYDISLIYSVLDELDDVFDRILNFIIKSQKNEKEKIDDANQLTNNYREFIGRIQSYAFDRKMENAIVALVLSISHAIEKFYIISFIDNSIILNLIYSTTIIVVKSLNNGFNFVLQIYNDVLADQFSLFQLYNREASIEACVTGSIKIYSEYEPEEQYDVYFENFLYEYNKLIDFLFKERNVGLINHIISEFDELVTIYSDKGLQDSLYSLFTTYFIIIQKCDDDIYIPIVKGIISRYLRYVFVTGSGQPEIKQLLIHQIRDLRNKNPKLFNETLTEFKENLKDKPGVIADLREEFP